MRLTAGEIETIQEAVRSEDPSATVYLFGSRLDDTRKGGDIDLYIETDHREKLLQLKVRIMRRLWARLGAQKIDILLRPHGTPPKTIHQIIRQGGVKL